MLFDWFSFTLKPDLRSSSPFLITLHPLLETLGLEEIFDNFTDIGAHRHYDHTYMYNNLCIYTTALSESSPDVIQNCSDSGDRKKYFMQGIHIEFSGSGCRFYESLFAEGVDVWGDLLRRLCSIQSIGCSLNIPRLDIAQDCYNNELNIDTIEECAKNGLYVSLYRHFDGFSQPELMPYKSHYSSSSRKCLQSKTVYFGNRRSNCCCKFYDKKMEQLHNKQLSDDERERISNMQSWVRFEITFKNTVAISVVNAFLDLSQSEFGQYFAKVINKYIRFCKDDNAKSNRRTIFKWWSDFLGTTETASLKVIGLSRKPIDAALSWFKQSVAPTFYALKSALGIGKLIELLDDSCSEERLRQKHYSIMSSSPTLLEKFPDDIEKWSLLRPSYEVNNATI